MTVETTHIEVQLQGPTEGSSEPVLPRDQTQEQGRERAGKYRLQRLLEVDELYRDALEAPRDFYSSRLLRRLDELTITLNRSAPVANVVETDPQHAQSGSGIVRGTGVDSEEEEGEQVEEKKNKKKTGGQTGHDPWRRFRRIDELVMDPRIQRHLDDHGVDAFHFLNDEHPLKIDRAAMTGKNIGDVFGACLEYTSQLERRDVCDDFRWFFMMILFHDIGLAINPNSRSERNLGRFGSTMASKMMRYFAKALDGHEIDLEELKGKLTVWSRIGRKLTYFGHHFGQGSIFYCREQLKEHFLKKEITFKGLSFTLGKAHLQTLGLDRMARDSGANELAKNIRQLTINAFRHNAGVGRD